jgi:hypothetical protein
MLPDQREWLSILVAIIAAGDTIPNFCIFKDKRFGRNYIKKCKFGATIAMQPHLWMTGILFNKCLNHLIYHVIGKKGILPTNSHLLILRGHNLYVTIDIVAMTRETRLDLLGLLSHTSHVLQPLNVFVFKPFKTSFWLYCNMWTMTHNGQAANKETLAQWVSLLL